MTDTSSSVHTARRRPLTVGLVVLVVGWLGAPLLCTVLYDAVGPKPGRAATLSQVHQGGSVILAFLAFGELAPIVVAVLAWTTGRRVLAVTAAVLLIAANVGLIVIGEPPWELLATAIEDVTADSAPITSG